MTSNVMSQIRVAKPLKDLGDIFEHSGLVKAKFDLQNPYRTDTIRILNIETSCGCTAVLTNDTIIPPQSTIELEVSYDPSGRLGLFVKSIEITTLTGKDERNKLYLKIMGNVVAENFNVQKVDQELINYKVAPIYFYPVTAFDTSYLDFNFIQDFVNDLTYEVDFYQFATVGVEVMVRSHRQIERLENLILYVEDKLKREFKRRGFSEKHIFFEEPIFIQSNSIPPWAQASFRVHSANFDLSNGALSEIEIASNEKERETKMLLDYQRFALPEVEEVLKEVNFEQIEGKLFLDGELSLKGMILTPWKKSKKLKQKLAKDLEKSIAKEIKTSTGAGKKVVSVSFDSLGVHPEDKYRFVLWDEKDVEKDERLKFEIKEDKITPPLLPTYVQTFYKGDKIDYNSEDFIHFWDNLIRNQKLDNTIKILIESSVEFDAVANNIELSKSNAEFVKRELQEKFFKETGDSIEYIIKPNLRGPRHAVQRKKINDNNNYIALIPIVNHSPNPELKTAKPYMVNFDFYFTGIDVGAWGFQRFANYIAQSVLSEGYIELRIESSISKIPVEKKKSNEDLAYQRLSESIIRLKNEMSRRLIDPNRIIFVDERVIKQGPEYNGSLPILAYKKFHYIRIIPEKSLKTN